MVDKKIGLGFRQGRGRTRQGAKAAGSRPIARFPRLRVVMSTPLITVQQHILEQQRRLYPSASGEFSWLLSGITLATKIVESRVRRAGLSDILGSAEEPSTSRARCSRSSTSSPTRSAALPRESRQCRRDGLRGERLADRRRARPRARPLCRRLRSLDGSSNIDVNVSVGTIFSILRRDHRLEPARATR